MIESVPTLSLSDSTTIPQLGFGVFQIPPGRTAEAVGHALATGYRSVDTAAAYHNEAGVGEAVRSSGLDRSEVFVTTKLWNSEHGRDRTLRAFEGSLQELGLDHVDLYLIHWPAPARDLYVETWQAMCELHAGGRARSIGVSNFQIEHLERIMDATGIAPSVNQVELHPHLQQGELRRFHEHHSILTEAWSPLGRGVVLQDPVIVRMAEELERTPAQIVLRWHIELGTVVIPKSVTPSRIEENFDIFGFELGQERVHALGRLDRGRRTGPDPDTMNSD